VKFDSRDFFIVAGNPDDSGNVSYSSTSPVVGLLYELTPAVNLYAAAGRGFETPTFAELAYRPDGSPGLNFNLQASKSHNYEIGAKAFLGQAARVNLAVFQTETEDEIVTALNIGGRSSFTNAAKTRRTGLELAADASFGAGFTGYLAWTYIDAEFREYSNVFTGQNLSGKKLPGVPKHSLYAELAWRYAPLGFSTALEGRYSSKVYVDDANTAASDSYTTLAVRAGFEQRFGRLRFTEFVRLDNVTDADYVGSVIVNEANQRFYEPAPTRNWFAGVTVGYTF
jgi:iron complex outermembrane recepter protein